MTSCSFSNNESIDYKIDYSSVPHQTVKSSLESSFDLHRLRKDPAEKFLDLSKVVLNRIQAHLLLIKNQVIGKILKYRQVLFGIAIPSLKGASFRNFNLATLEIFAK